MVGNRSSRARMLVMGVTAMLALAGCPAELAEDPDTRTTSAYIVVIDNLASRVTLDAGDSEDLPTLFVESFDAAGIALEVQVAVVTHFESTYDVRFIDDRNEAIDVELPELPVRPFSLLIGLGPLVGDDADDDGLLDVRGELYLDESAIQAYRFALTEQSDDSWSLVEPAESIDPEGFGTVQ